MPNILIVDDDVMLRRLISVYLNAGGYNIDEASTGADAIKSLGAKSADLIILDSMMPDGDGASVLRHVRSNPQIANLPVLMLSARGRSADKVDAFNQGADDYIVKPFDSQELAARVDRMIARKHLA